jgi:hypothetical protein
MRELKQRRAANEQRRKESPHIFWQQQWRKSVRKQLFQ